MVYAPDDTYKKAKEEMKIGQLVCFKDGEIFKLNALNSTEILLGICAEDIKEGDDCILENGILRKVKND